MNITWVAPDTLIPYPGNAKQHPPEQLDHIANSIKRFGWQQPIVVDKNNVVVIGHGRLAAAQQLFLESVPVVVADNLTDEEINALRLADNKTNESGWDFGKLEEELAALAIEGIDMTQFGFDEMESKLQTETENHAGRLNEKFGVPPFSVLDARQGYWKERKEQWRALIGDTGQARGNAEAFGTSLQNEKYGITSTNTVSILDPVLSEIICKWFLPGAGCKVFDCFAGDTVFGFVSAHLGNSFTGIELRQEQVDFNNTAVEGMEARYICDDGRNVADHIEKESQDLFFSCPPYFDLEQYSDLPNDASNQETYADFYKILDTAFMRAASCLKPNRFAVVVCGDVRNKKTGEYYRFPEDIKGSFARAGLCLYNELILVDPVGTATIRAGRYMQTRKVAKVHQNVLVFYKGDTKQISNEFPEIEVEDESADFE